MHCDLVFNFVEPDFWNDYDINYSKLRKINYFGINTYAPSKQDTEKVLRKQYGINYLIPDIKYPKDFLL